MFMGEKRFTIFICVSSLLICLAMFIMEQMLTLTYIEKTGMKILLFTIMPIIHWFNLSNMRRKKRKAGHSWGIALGFSVFIVITVTYFVFSHLLNSGQIVSELNEQGVNVTNYIFVGLYIILGNSFVEEFFFRGYIFLNIYKMGKKKTAYVFSSILFALYHIGIFLTWFELWLIIVIVVCLYFSGMLFNWLNTKCGSYINSWIVHASADLAIVLIGYHMFIITK